MKYIFRETDWEEESYCSNFFPPVGIGLATGSWLGKGGGGGSNIVVCLLIPIHTFL